MGVQVKKLKVTTPKLTLGVVTGLTNLLPQFKTACYADHQRISEILQILATTEALRGQICNDFFKANGLDQTESIGADHPLSRELFPLIMNAETAIDKTATAVFSVGDFNIAVDGLPLTYADRDFLMNWLVK